MAEDDTGSCCCICWSIITPKQRRVINSPSFKVTAQLEEVLTKAISSSDKYVCTFCFAKLNRLSKIHFDLENRIETLKKEKNEVLSALRGKINLTQNSKRQIIHSPTPRKLKRIPPSRSTPQSQQHVKRQIQCRKHRKHQREGGCFT